MTRRFAGHVAVSSVVQLVVNQRHQLVEGTLVSIAPGLKQARDLVGRVPDHATSLPHGATLTVANLPCMTDFARGSRGSLGRGGMMQASVSHRNVPRSSIEAKLEGSASCGHPKVLRRFVSAEHPIERRAHPSLAREPSMRSMVVSQTAIWCTVLTSVVLAAGPAIAQQRVSASALTPRRV